MKISPRWWQFERWGHGTFSGCIGSCLKPIQVQKWRWSQSPAVPLPDHYPHPFFFVLASAFTQQAIWLPLRAETWSGSSVLQLAAVFMCTWAGTRRVSEGAGAVLPRLLAWHSAGTASGSDYPGCPKDPLGCCVGPPARLASSAGRGKHLRTHTHCPGSPGE